MGKERRELWSVCKPQMVPAITDGQIEEMLAVMKPIMKVNGRGKKDDDGHRWREILTEGVHGRDVAYTWEAKLGRPLKLYVGGLNEVNILTFHTWGYYGFFKPSLAESLGCIRQFVPEWREVRFFWLDSGNMGPEHIVGDFHWCRCKLFGPEMLDVIDSDWDEFAGNCTGVK